MRIIASVNNANAYITFVQAVQRKVLFDKECRIFYPYIQTNVRAFLLYTGTPGKASIISNLCSILPGIKNIKLKGDFKNDE